jgi:hypothetical protein
MTDPALQIYLPAFMLIATWLIIFWNQFRKNTQMAHNFLFIAKINIVQVEEKGNLTASFI